MQNDCWAGDEFTKAGRDRQGRQRYRCTRCGRRLTPRSRLAFSGERFPDEVSALAVRHSLRYRLSSAAVVAWLAERGVTGEPSTIYHWVRAFTPRFIEAARTLRAPVGHRWRVDETYLKLVGPQRSLVRALDEHGQISDVYLSDRRTADAARTCFKAAIQGRGVTPTRVTTDKAKCDPPVLRTMLPVAEHRSSKYLNNGLERDHQQLNGRVRPMRRFKTMGGAHTCCRGHTLIQNLGRGFSRLTAEVRPGRRLATTWAALTATL